MKQILPALVCVGWIAFWVGWTFGLKGQPFNTTPGHFGWGHVLVPIILIVPAALSAFVWGKKNAGN